MKRNPLSQAILALRTTARLTQPEMANRLGVSTRTVVRLERDAEPSLPVLEELEKLAAESQLPQLAKLFEQRLEERRKEIAPAFDSSFLMSGKMKHVPIEDFDRLAQLIHSAADNWENIEPAVTKNSNTRIQKIRRELEKDLREMKQLIRPYGGKSADSTSG
jgi:transcriptional regulator with XRE-family HTH domain